MKKRQRYLRVCPRRETLFNLRVERARVRQESDRLRHRLRLGALRHDPDLRALVHRVCCDENCTFSVTKIPDYQNDAMIHEPNVESGGRVSCSGLMDRHLAEGRGEADEQKFAENCHGA